MSTFHIQGDSIISGEISPSGNKNEALPAIAATLLTDETVILERVPRIKDVETLCEIISEMGGQVEWVEAETISINCSKTTKKNPDAKLSEKIRASILLLGPLLSRFGHVEMPLPGGDVIGARRIDSHFEGIEAVGGEASLNGIIRAKIDHKKGGDIFLDEPSVTATENLIMLACIGKKTTTIHNAACEPHVVGLCKMLVKMGAKITGIGSNRLLISGVERLGGCTHKVGPDFMEVGSFLCLGAIGRGVVKINSIVPEDLRFSLKSFKKIGIEPEVGEDYLIIDGTKKLKTTTDVSGRVASIYSGPWPAFPTDLMSVAIVAATQAEGTLIFHEKMFEGRMFFTDKLMAMGANIVLCDPHRIVVNGPAKLSSSHMSSPDVRAGMAMIMAAAIAKGTSVIDNIIQVERGYSRIDEKLRNLGVPIEKVPTTP